jgi:hypothetical protein
LKQRKRVRTTNDVRGAAGNGRPYRGRGALINGLRPKFQMPTFWRGFALKSGGPLRGRQLKAAVTYCEAIGSILMRQVLSADQVSTLVLS